MMDLMKTFIDFFLHIDKNLLQVVNQFGIWSYFILFMVIFMETGFVVTPFLPGDSLLFAAGAISAFGGIHIWWLLGLMILAAFVGDTVNYWIGHFMGPKVFDGKNKLLKKEHLEKAQSFYEKHGGKAIVLARFVPIVRTFAPFVAGVGKMDYSKFIMFNALGGVLWVSLFTLAGYFFGNIPMIKENFHYLIVGIVVLSLVPIFVEWYKSKKG